MSPDLLVSPALPHVAVLVALVASVMVGVPAAELTAPRAARERVLRTSDDFALVAALVLATDLLAGVTALAQGTLGVASGRAWLAIPSHALALLTLALATFALLRGAWFWRGARTFMAGRFGPADAARTARS